MDDRQQAIDALLDAEAAAYMVRTARAFAHLSESAQHLPLGVATSFQSHYPYPLLIESGAGAHVTDLDGNTYLDLHAGFGAMVCGHAHPRIVRAIRSQAQRGAHFGYPHEQLAALAAHLCERFAMQQLRFSLSGTEAVMDALRVARTFTARQLVVRAEGAYHGHSPEGLISVKPHPDQAGDASSPNAVAASAGLPPGAADQVRVVAFNDLDGLARLLAADGRQIACLLLEPVMCNLGMVAPADGYLHGVKELCARHGVLLIFDEVKTALTVSRSGAGELYGVEPDLRVLGKAIGGGLPLAAFGGRAEVMAVIADGRAPHYGTFAGNPLAVAAAHAALTEVITPRAFDRAAQLAADLQAGCDEIIARHDLPWHTMRLGLKGAMLAARRPLRHYRDYLSELDRSLAQLQWTFLANRGMLVAPGADEQWTLSVAFTDADVTAALRTLDAWAQLAASLPPQER